jgi:hypothetical protein
VALRKSDGYGLLVSGEMHCTEYSLLLSSAPLLSILLLLSLFIFFPHPYPPPSTPPPLLLSIFPLMLLVILSSLFLFASTVSRGISKAADMGAACREIRDEINVCRQTFLAKTKAGKS